ncbi:MAG: hexose kinase [Synergistaceae bacterium]|jgi:1-phosphofructokinase family hexose kinase|nr:hexose kinase [Synergistaceae bacterium]
MIVTVTPNPAMDESYATDEFKPGRWHRARSVVCSPGGRGVNVSIILKQLGYDSVSTGFLAGHTGGYIRDKLLSWGITANFVNIKGRNSTNTFIRDASGAETAVTEEGPAVSSDALKRFFWNMERLMPRATAVQMGGDLPPGVPDTFYRDVIDIVKRKNVPVYIDASGTALDLAVEALPTVVKIDRRSGDSGRNVTPPAMDHLMETAKRIFDEGVDCIIASHSDKSNLFCTTKGFYLAEIKPENPVTYRAAGDALMAGMMAAREERMSMEDTMRFGMSCVIQTVSCPRKGLPSRAAVESTLGGVTIRKV